MTHKSYVVSIRPSSFEADFKGLLPHREAFPGRTTIPAAFFTLIVNLPLLSGSQILAKQKADPLSGTKEPFPSLE